MKSGLADAFGVATPSFSRSIVRSLVPRQITLVVIGAGNVGSTFLDQLAEQQSILAQSNIRVRVCAIANSRSWVGDLRGINLKTWRESLKQCSQPTNIRSIFRFIDELRFTEVAVVDCTASEAIVDAYATFVELGAHVITPNKKVHLLPWHTYERLFNAFARRELQFLYATNVGAGLPVLSTLRDLSASGDKVERIEGVLSGTLSFLFNSFDGSQPFSSLVEKARILGYTEPDPRVDLSGMDVANKLLVLARQLGWPLEIDDVIRESCARSDDVLAALQAEAAAQSAVLRYVASLSEGQASARLVAVPLNHALANTRHTDNVFAFHTRRYCTSPLVIQGPGAGADVTAAGLVTEVIRLLRCLPG